MVFCFVTTSFVGLTFRIALLCVDITQAAVILGYKGFLSVILIKGVKKFGITLNYIFRYMKEQCVFIVYYLDNITSLEVIICY